MVHDDRPDAAPLVQGDRDTDEHDVQRDEDRTLGNESAVSRPNAVSGGMRHRETGSDAAKAATE